jgi:phosphatidylglycerol:prolipoprotein diacylglycerol transferase
MYPELFNIPFLNVTLKSYGLLMVIGFLAAVYLIKRLSKNITPDSQLITNAALYSLIAGVAGARLFYVIHYYDDKFKGDLLSTFAIWDGGLELLGGVILAVTVIILYMRHHKLPIRKYIDILAVGLLLALTFGRIGCFLSGCCWGKPTNLPWAVRFPYGSNVFRSQINPDPKRNRPDPYIQLPDEFFELVKSDGLWYSRLKPYDKLTDEQKLLVKVGPYRILPVHPTQLYSSASAAFCCLLLYLFWKRAQKAQIKNPGKLFIKPGCTFALMFILYGITRFLLEFVRDDNPFEFNGLTISQNISIAMLIFGICLMTVFQSLKLENNTPPPNQNQ